uniref:Uncharacterized protein n=1 Tax=Panagrellus redivivus TaxID=6233 RepID=A0A7E4VPJ3_PANRE
MAGSMAMVGSDGSDGLADRGRRLVLFKLCCNCDAYRRVEDDGQKQPPNKQCLTPKNPEQRPIASGDARVNRISPTTKRPFQWTIHGAQHDYTPTNARNDSQLCVAIMNMKWL